MSSDLKLKEGLAAVIGGTVGDVDALVEASKIAATKYVPILRDAQRRIEALEAEVAFVKGQLAGTNKNIAGWLQSRDDNLRRAEFAEAQLDEALSGCRETNSRAEAAEARAERLRGALRAIEQADYYGCVSEFAAKALEGSE